MSVPDFQKLFNQFTKQLALAIKGRENSIEWVKPVAKDNREHALTITRVPVNTSEGMFDFSFVIHADCSCSAIGDFLKLAKLENITFAEGPRKGKVLGISGKSIDGFYAYKI